MSASGERGEVQNELSDGAQIHSTAYLLEKSVLTPKPFHSGVPILGTLIVWFRNIWNSVSTRWYLAPLIAQQSEFNHLVVQELHAFNQDLVRLSRQAEQRHAELHALRQEVQMLSQHVQGMHGDLSAVGSRTTGLENAVRALIDGQHELTQHVQEVSDRLTAGDQEIATLVHDLGALTYSVVGLNERVPDVVESAKGFPPQQSS